MSEIYERVDTFIQRLHDLEYIITPEAKTIVYESKENKKDRSMLADELSNSITIYESRKDDDITRMKYARICNVWINRAFSCGVVRESEGLVKKLKECRDRNVRLESDLEKLSLDYLELQGLTSRLGLPDEDDLERQR